MSPYPWFCPLIQDFHQHGLGVGARSGAMPRAVEDVPESAPQEVLAEIGAPSAGSVQRG